MTSPDAEKNICIIGDGGWGTALAIALHGNGHNICVWGAFASNIEQIISTRENPFFLPGIHIPDQIRWTSDPETAIAGADLAVIAVPTKYFRPVLERFRGFIKPACRIVSVAKGLDQKTHQRMTDVAHEVLGCSHIAALSGPTHAEEVARHVPAAVVIASSSAEYCVELQSIFASKCFRVYTSQDVAGVELGGALKNIIAIAAGVSDGLEYGDNARAALITRGLAEITRLGTALGAKQTTFYGLSGIGDLVVTCTSKWSRNHTVGERLGKGETIESIMGSMKQVAEGVWNCGSARELAAKTGIEVPITDEVYRIIHEHKSPAAAVQSLLSRDFKAE
jgi:glycerol-3-phosphate dehydrogenase (NAD(P)+)